MTSYELIISTTEENLKKLTKEKEKKCDKFEVYAHLKILEKVATLNNDSFLLKTVSGIRADWPQFHM